MHNITASKSDGVLAVHNETTLSSENPADRTPAGPSTVPLSRRPIESYPPSHYTPQCQPASLPPIPATTPRLPEGSGSGVGGGGRREGNARRLLARRQWRQASSRQRACNRNHGASAPADLRSDTQCAHPRGSWRIRIPARYAIGKHPRAALAADIWPLA